MERKPQNLQNHVKLDPVFHFFLGPASMALFIWSVYRLITEPSGSAAWIALAGLWALIATFKIRLYSLKVQDRVIRLEERLRMEKMLPPALSSRTYELTEQQLIALRFASDGELAALVEKTLSAKLPPKEIKKAVQSWRPDYWRV